jgi:ubiquinol-cytochrome c reductase cytochrome b subunit
LLVLVLLATFPWIERRLTGDFSVHNLADRPRDAPNRTAFGVALLSWVFLIFAFGAADRVFVLWGLNYDTQLYIFRVAVWVVPLVLFFGVRRLCRELQHADQIEETRERAEEEAEAHQRTMAARAHATP